MALTKSRWMYVLAGVALFGCGIAAGIGLSSSSGSTASIEALSGKVTEVVPAGNYFDVCLLHGGRCSGYPFSPSTVNWRDSQGVWHEGQGDLFRAGGYLPCLKPSSSGQVIKFGLVTYDPVGDAIGSQDVAWIECPLAPGATG
jgi:hypothetical protein